MAEPNIRPEVEESPATPVSRSSVNAMSPSAAVRNPSAVDSTRTTNRQRFQLSELGVFSCPANAANENKRPSRLVRIE
jgi:hypothetical protein